MEVAGRNEAVRHGKRDENKKTMETENEIVGRLFGQDISREKVEEWAEAFWDGTYGDLASIKNGLNHYLHISNSLVTCVCLEDDTREVDNYGEVIRAPLLREYVTQPEDMDPEDGDDVESWQECYDENHKAQTIGGWVEEIISNLDEIPEPSFIRLTDADSDDYDVEISDGFETSYYNYPPGAESVYPQEVADFYLSGYDGEGEIRFIIGFSCDAGADGDIQDWIYASGLPDHAAEIHYDLTEGQKKIWLC